MEAFSPIKSVCFQDETDKEQAVSLASRLSLPLIRAADASTGLRLQYVGGCLLLIEGGAKTKPLAVEFNQPAMMRRIGQARGKGELLYRVLKPDKTARPNLLDLTAGLGTDSMIFAAMGYRVTALERSPIIYELLKDGLARASAVDLMQKPVSQINLILQDARHYLEDFPAQENPPVIYLDPMYPERKNQAESRRETRVLREVVGTDPDSEALLQLALSKEAKKVVVKRPIRAKALSRPPEYCIKGTAVRFDIYLN